MVDKSRAYPTLDSDVAGTVGLLRNCYTHEPPELSYYMSDDPPTLVMPKASERPAEDCRVETCNQ